MVSPTVDVSWLGVMVAYFLSGAVEARINGAVASLGGPKQRCVLAVLLADHGTVVSVDRLIDAVWEDEPPAKALTSLRSYLANLRKNLASSSDAAAGRPSRLESRQSGYQLNLVDDDSVDLHEFETLVKTGYGALGQGDGGKAFEVLTRALALWRGDPFGEFTYRDFAHSDALRYVELRNTAVETRFDAALRLGDGRELISEIEAAIAQDPLQERLWAHLMLALYRTGRPAEAVRAYDRATAVLDSEIGTQPGERLQILHQKVSDGSAELLLDAQAPRRIVLRDRPASGREQLFGRTTELDAMAESLSDASAGRGGLILVTGDSGIGKSSLAQAVCDDTNPSNMAIAWATHPTDIQLPLMWTWIQILRQLGTDLGEPGRDTLRRTAPGVIDALVPEWNDRRDATSMRTPATGFDLVEGVVTALRKLSSLQPLLLILDDLQVADSASCDALALLTDHLPRLPIEIIGNWTFLGRDRPVNRGSFQRLIRSSGVKTVHLRGLQREAADDLVEALAGGPAPSPVLEYIRTRAAGNPFYIKELVRMIAGANGLQEAPESVEDNVSEAVAGVVGRRLAALDRQCRPIMEAAAVFGPQFDVTALAGVVHLSAVTVDSRLQPAYEAGLIDEIPSRPGGYRFSHGLLRDAVLAQVPPTDRAYLHAAIATSEAAAVDTAAYEDVIAAADHAWRAGSELDADLGLDVHDAVIRRALMRAAYNDVAVLAARALDICRRMPPKPESLDQQATLWLHLACMRSILDGQSSTSVGDAVQRAFEIGERARGRNFYGTVALQCLNLCGQGRIDEAQALANGLIDQYAKSHDPDIGVASHFVEVMIHGLRGDIDAQDATARKMLALFPPPDEVVDPLQFFHPRVYCWLALGQAMRGNRDTALDYCRTGLELAQTRRDLFNVLAAKLVMVEIDAVLGIVDGTAATADGVYEEMSATGAHQWAACATMVSVWAKTLSSENISPDRAFEAFDLYTNDGSTVMTPFFLALLADIENHHGRSHRAHELLIRAQAVARTTGERAWDEQLARRIASHSMAE
ncbi:transcriptional regulator [Mycolicibacterium moriokaense]|uniref:Transcriptional regulator n=2 Tax=Mycolicibacterium moriokaense TaxID=39691 RepID=A0A318I0L2_9MYCO|nr:transcriptional regulator [Mycolicibacterium moriokaense]